MRVPRRPHAATRSPYAAALAAVALLAGGGCSRATTAAAPPRAPTPLVVENNGFFDVAVYAVPAGAGPGFRIGTASAFSTTRLVVRPNLLQPSELLVVRLRALGTGQSWVSPGVAVGRGLVARLAVFTNGDGALSRSVLYTGAAGRR